MVEVIVKGTHPETGEPEVHEIKAKATCAVSIEEGGEENQLKVDTAIIGDMSGAIAEAMIDALMGACKAILNSLPPSIAAVLMLKKLVEGREEDVAGTSDESERPAEQ